MNLALLEGLAHDPDTTYDEKMARAMALHARWKYEYTKEQALEGDALKARQQTRCRELGLIVFGFTLHDAQVEAICTLFFEQRDLLLLAKTGFGKSVMTWHVTRSQDSAYSLISFFRNATSLARAHKPSSPCRRHHPQAYEFSSPHPSLGLARCHLISLRSRLSDIASSPKTPENRSSTYVAC